MVGCRSCILVLAFVLLATGGARAQSGDRILVDVSALAGARESIIESTTCAEPQHDQRVFGMGARLHREGAFGIGVEVSRAERCRRPAFTYYQPQMIAIVQAIRDIGPHKRLRPYIIFGAGLVTHRQEARSPRYPRIGPLTAAGAGLRIALTDRLSAWPELQFGFDRNLFRRTTINVGYRLR